MSGKVNNTIIVQANLDLPAAQSQREAHLLAIAPGDVILDIDSPACTTPALQVLLASYRSLQSKQALAGLGPNASAILENVDF